MRALYSTHTNTTYRCHKPTAPVKEVASNLLGWEAFDCISNVPSLPVGMLVLVCCMFICYCWNIPGEIFH